MANLTEINAVIGSAAQLVIAIGGAVTAILAFVQTAKNKAYGKSGAEQIKMLATMVTGHDEQLTALSQNVGAALAAAESLKAAVHGVPAPAAPAATVTGNTGDMTEAATETPPEAPTTGAPAPWSSADEAEDIPTTPAPPSLQSAFDEALTSLEAARESQTNLITALQARRAAAYPSAIPGAIEQRLASPQPAGEVIGTGPGG